ncbi:MAG: methyltransferase domain-containing protein [Acidimicrobiales bacterium]
MTDWDPDQYRRFAAERAQPFHDLLALLRPTGIRRAIDLGCGPGELTALAARTLGVDEMTGVDNSPEMLHAAAAHAGDGLRFEHGDLATWTSDGDHDLVLAAASLQWVPDHATVLERWTRALRPGGQLAVQVPANAHAPTHTVAAAVAASPEHVAAFGPAGPPPDPVATNVLAPEAYARVLHELGYVDLHVQLRVYTHLLPTTRHAVEWVKGTTLTRFKAVMTPEQYTRFLDDYERELVAAMGDEAPCFFPFNRILFTAHRPT